VNKPWKEKHWESSNVEAWLYQILVILTLGLALVPRIIITRAILVAMKQAESGDRYPNKDE
jgi:hypothetical protein